jgi:hypothetical protein
MGQIFDSLDPFIQEHVRQLMKPSGLPEGDESLESLASAWLEKKDAFEGEVAAQGMEEVDFFAKDEERGALAMTYSGSLVNIGPLVDGKRLCEYSSIGLRKDVPQAATEESCSLESDIESDAPASFTKGPVRKTSPILKIAMFKKSMAPEKEEEKLSEVTQILSDNFVEVNKTVIR